MRPTGYGDSPYQSLSAFAGNPLLISPDLLLEDGYLEASDLDDRPPFPPGRVEFSRVVSYKKRLLRRAQERFNDMAPEQLRAEFAEFRLENAWWLDDFTLFMALKQAHEERPWWEWEEGLARRDSNSVESWRSRTQSEREYFSLQQFIFFRQWNGLKDFCNRQGIRIMGDVPIFVAADSSDVWGNQELFLLDGSGRPTAVAGVPPDYFSETGQLWGNPLYRWDVMAESGYDWWIARIRAEFELVDLLRVDHFRGFDAYWAVPADHETAIHGEWVPGPGHALFEALTSALGELPIVAENLGVITPESEDLRTRFGFPGMAILQFAFGTDSGASSFRPHNYARDLVVYTGTHDNDTAVGWWLSTGENDSTRTPEEVEREKARAREYLSTDGHEIHWTLIRWALSSVANIAIIPVQDILGLGSEARMNRPGKGTENWSWRFSDEALTEGCARRLRELSRIYGRLTSN